MTLGALTWGHDLFGGADFFIYFLAFPLKQQHPSSVPEFPPVASEGYMKE